VIDESTDAKHVLLTILRSSAEIVSEHREIYSMNLDFWAASRGSAFEDRFSTACRDMYRVYRSLTAEVIRRGQREGIFRTEIDADMLATMVVSALDGLGVQSWVDDRVDPVPATESFATALFNGLCRESP
jgi:hypothetical protein